MKFIPKYNPHIVKLENKNEKLKSYNGVCLYIVTCKDKNHFYIGITNQPKIRKEAHRTGIGGAYFVKRHGFKEFKILVWLNDRKMALDVEQQYTHKMRCKYKNYIFAGSNIGHLD
jgi:predicted GIY-YIG superfamily endonuclease